MGQQEKWYLPERHGREMVWNPVQAYSMIFITGGFLYCGVEFLYRGFSHISMFFTAGVCFLMIGVIEHILGADASLLLEMLFCGLMITVIELLVGLLVNRQLHWNVWDYSGQQYNLKGQICLWNSTLWFFLSGPAIVLYDLMRYFLLGTALPQYRIF